MMMGPKMVIIHATKVENVIARLMWLDQNAHNVKADTTNFQTAYVM